MNTYTLAVSDRLDVWQINDKRATLVASLATGAGQVGRIKRVFNDAGIRLDIYHAAS